jgi:hypothetical protein
MSLPAKLSCVLLLLCSALAFVTLASAADPQSAHDRAFARRWDELVDELQDLAEAPDLQKLADIQRRMAELEEERYDYTKDETDVCPVHHVKMAAHEARIQFGLLMFSDPQPGVTTRQSQFPFARDWIMGGCVLPHDAPKAGRVFLCPQCVEAEKAWVKAHRK